MRSKNETLRELLQYCQAGLVPWRSAPRLNRKMPRLLDSPESVTALQASSPSQSFPT